MDLSSDKISIPNGFASPLYNVESFVPAEVSYSSSYYPSYQRLNDFTPRTIGVRTLKGAIETSGIAGQFQSPSAFNAIETLLGYRVIDIGSEYQLNPVNDPSGNPQPISAFTLNGLNFSVKAGTPFVLKSADAAQTDLYFESKNSTIEATAEFEGGTLTVEISSGTNLPAMRVDLRTASVQTSRFVSFVSAEIGGIKFTSGDGASFGVDTINNQFLIGLANFTATPDALSGPATGQFFENITQVFTPQAVRGIFSVNLANDSGSARVYKLAAQKRVGLGSFGINVDDTAGIIDRAAFATGLQAELRKIVTAGSSQVLPLELARLTSEERQAIAQKITVEYQASGNGLPFGQYRIKGMPARLQLNINDVGQTAEYRGVGASPVRFTVPSINIKISNGVLQPIEDVSVTALQLGETRISNSGQYSTTYKTIELGSNSNLKLKYYPRYTSIVNSDRTVPGNTFGFYGAQVPLALKVTGLTLGGTGSSASLGTIADPGLLAVNGQFYELNVPVPEVTVDTMKFTSSTLDGFSGLRLLRRPRIGDIPRSYTVEGAALFKGGIGIIKTDLNVLFGLENNKGLQIFPDSDSYLTSFSIRKGFLFGGS